MIEASIILGLILTWFAAVMGTTWYCFEGRQLSLKILFFIITFLFSACLLSLLIGKESENPCLEYETTMMYNAATKTMMPVRSCKKRGEWVEEKGHD